MTNQPISNQPITTLSIPVDLIDPNPEQPRRDFDERKLKELANSIQENGLIQPIVVEAADNGRYVLHGGERRWRAHQLLGLAEIQANVIPPGADKTDLLIRATVENVQRADLTPVEFAHACQELHDQGLDDKQVAKKLGKSRPAIANARRLLNLPQEVQAQVEKGELSERQAMALLPLYQLPEEVQTKIIENHWDGRKLQNPKNLTSDQIRSHLRAATRAQGQELSLIEADAEYTGDGICCPTCAACDLYTKVGNDMLCLNEACLTTKQNQVIAAYLAGASEATGLPALDPFIHYEWDQTSGFYNTGLTLETALHKKCPNLHLTFNRRSWDSGSGPEEFPKCRYTCLHNGDGCTCANASKEEQKRATKEKEKAIQQLKSKAHDHLSKIARDSPEAFLRAILFSTTGYGIGNHDDSVLTFSSKKIITRLARWLLERNAPPSLYHSIDENQQCIDEWLIKMDFPPLDGYKNPIPDLDRRLSRVETWIANGQTTPNAIRGNLANLAKLAEEIYLIDDGLTEEEDLQALLPRLDTAKQTLLAWQGQVDIILELDHFEAWLISAEAITASKKKFINRSAKVADLSHDLRALELPPDQAEPIQARIDALELQYIAAGRTTVRAQTNPSPEEKEVRTV